MIDYMSCYRLSAYRATARAHTHVVTTRTTSIVTTWNQDMSCAESIRPLTAAAGVVDCQQWRIR